MSSIAVATSGLLMYVYYIIRFRRSEALGDGDRGDRAGGDLRRVGDLEPDHVRAWLEGDPTGGRAAGHERHRDRVGGRVDHDTGVLRADGEADVLERQRRQRVGHSGAPMALAGRVATCGPARQPATWRPALGWSTWRPAGRPSTCGAGHVRPISRRVRRCGSAARASPA